jgi:hypothetical protein
VAISVVYPELVTGREDGFASGEWTVRPGSNLRGEASCNLTDRILLVPLGRDGTSRVVRAHELMHARVSPHLFERDGALDDLSPRALECAEELRINPLVGRLDFDVGLLRDGSEKYGGRRLAENAEWSEALCFLMAVVGTGAEKDYLAGVRQGNPSWLPGLRALRKRALSLLDGLSTSSLGSTCLNDEQVPAGYANATIVLARIVTQSMSARPPTSPDELRAFRRSLEPGGRRPPSGRFATLKFDSSLVMSPRPRGAGIRRARPSATGASMRYPSRLLTDDLKRAFARPATFHGGIVVIDQSGSMDIDPAQLQALLRRAPDALVVGYSHRPGERGDVANAWLLANRGAVASSCPSGNVGNGVDGPMLLWALGQRRCHEPVLWVTDGQVTDSHDHPDDELTFQCAQLVRVHRIRLVRDLEGAARMLSLHSPVRPAKWTEFGRLGRKLAELPHF